MMNWLKRITTKTPAKRVSSHGYTNHRQPIVNTRFPAKRYFREDLGLELKSSMEANYLRFMRYLGVECQYEPERFTFPPGASRLGVTGYIPDFKLSAGKHIWYIECKGYKDATSIEKARLMSIFYPYIRIYTVGWETYKIIEKHYKNRIKNWE